MVSPTLARGFVLRASRPRLPSLALAFGCARSAAPHQHHHQHVARTSFPAHQPAPPEGHSKPHGTKPDAETKRDAKGRGIRISRARTSQNILKRGKR
jgi:hypothetical protein